MKRFGLFIACLVYLIPTLHAKEGDLKTSPLAVAFGSQPDLRSLRLSPDGSKLVFIQYHPDGYDFVRTFDLSTKKISEMILSGTKGGYEISMCWWASNERVLCSFSGTVTMGDMHFPATKLAAVNADGKQMKLLEPKQLEGNSASIIDMMPDDPDHVRVQLLGGMQAGIGTMDIYTGTLVRTTRSRKDIFSWLYDGHGEPRFYQTSDSSYRRWYARNEKDEDEWDVVREIKADDFEDLFMPVGFDNDQNELLYFDDHEGRRALFAMDLAHNREIRLVFAHERVDVLPVLQRLGKYDRVVSGYYVDEKLRQFFFDPDIQRIHDMLASGFPGKNINIIDEDWNRRYYLVMLSSDLDPGMYYRYDSQDRKLEQIGSISAKLKDRKLAPMTAITYPARDNTPIPAFLSLPTGEKKTKLPVVILPHGGPSSLDIWGFDFLAQFLTANGYAVLQSNYRGSEGYGKAWKDKGAFHNWKTAINDLTDGAQYLIDQGIADPDKICTVGWSYGGYAAMMSAIENPSLYQCIVSIAGVSDPRTLGFMARRMGGPAQQAFIGTGSEVVEEGSPRKRAGEIQVPVLLIHAKLDMNVPFKQSVNMYDALLENTKSVEFIEYEKAEHSIRPPRYRIDMLTRLAEFLDQHTH